VFRTLANLTTNDAENKTRAGTAGAVEAMAAAMRAHMGSAGVQEAACSALRNLTLKDAENRTRAGTAGVVEAVAAAMRAHAGSADVQHYACLA
jgi:tryptophan synthase beta subunit